MAQENENNKCYVQFPITKTELLALSIYLKDKDNDIKSAFEAWKEDWGE